MFLVILGYYEVLNTIPVSANIIKSVITDMNPICNTQFYIYYIDSVDN